KRVIVDRECEAGGGVVRHLDGLLWRAVARNPGIVGADWRDHHVGRPATDVCEAGARRVSGKADATASAFQHVTVEAAVHVVTHPGSPMTYSKGVDGDVSVRRVHAPRLVPPDFDDAREPEWLDQVRGAGCGDDGGAARQAPHR